MDRLLDLGWYVVQRKSIVYSKEFYEGELDQGEYNRGMVGHFGQDKTIAIIREHYFLP